LPIGRPLAIDPSPGKMRHSPPGGIKIDKIRFQSRHAIEMESLMRVIAAVVATLMLAAPASAAETGVETPTFAVVRNGSQIGTHAIELRRNGPETLVKQSTRIEVKVLFIQAYKFEQDETERWVNNRLVAMDSVTHDNGTDHKLDVRVNGKGLNVEGDGKTAQVDATVMPASIWNAALVKQTVALNVRDGSLMHITVNDMGMDNVTVRGQPVKARHYEIKGPFSQDAWYDDKGNLVQAKFIGSDNSVIMWQLM